MWNKLKKWIGDYADTWTKEQVEAEVRNYVRFGGGAVGGVGVAADNWWVVLAGILPFIAVQIWYYLSKLNNDLPQP